MKTNFNVKIISGKMTKTEVQVYYTAVNDERVEFNTGNGCLKSKLADAIRVAIEVMLKENGLDVKSSGSHEN